MQRKYEYAAELIKVVDGDTVDLRIDLGFYMSAALRFRLLGVDTPELRGGTDETKAKARVAKDFVLARLEAADQIRATTYKADSFGRWLADVEYLPPGSDAWLSMSLRLIDEGMGVARDK